MIVTLGTVSIIPPPGLGLQAASAIAPDRFAQAPDPRGSFVEAQESTGGTLQRQAIHGRRDANQPGWSAVGLDGGVVEGLVGIDGGFAAATPGPRFAFWLRDDTTGRLSQPTSSTVSQSLVGGHLPLIRTVWSVDGAVVDWTVFAQSTGPDPISRLPGDVPLELVQATVTGRRPGGSWTLYVVTLPDTVTGSTYPITRLAATSTSLTINGQLMLIATRHADAAGAIDQAHRDPLSLGVPGVPDAPTSLVSDYGLGMGFLGYHVHLAPGQTASYSFALPLGDTVLAPERIVRLRDLNVGESQNQVAAAWRRRLEHVVISLPDVRLTDAFYASVAYLLMARGDDSFFSGPTSEHAIWVRDSAYIAAALTRAGQARVVEPVLRLLVSAQLPSGREPPIIEADGSLRRPLKSEWDAEGELIFALVDYARQTHDPAFLRDVYPSIRRAAQFQEEQLAAARQPALAGTPFYGILPPGESAEDLYDATWHHYWDDFWALAGFQQAASAAQMLGYPAEASRLSAEEAALRTDVLNSVVAGAKTDQPPYIPNGPEDINTTAMARSGTPAIWPVEVLDPRSSLVRHSFDVYDERAIQPYGGAYRHYGNDDWPYAGLDLAHAFYRLGMVDRAWQILDWTMSHQSAPNLYAWAEAIDPDRFTVISGDLPHSWMAAELVLFVRDVLVREDGNRLDVGPYPSNWLAPGATVSVDHLPTSLGDAGYTIRRAPNGRTIQITLAGTVPPGGYQINLPNNLSVVSGTTSEGSLTLVDPHHVLIPSTARQTTLTLVDSPVR